MIYDIEKQLREVYLTIEKARTKTSVPKGGKMLKPGQSVPKGSNIKTMKGGAKYVTPKGGEGEPSKLPKGAIYIGNKQAPKGATVIQGPGGGNYYVPTARAEKPEDEKKSRKKRIETTKKIKAKKEALLNSSETKVERSKVENYDDSLSTLRNARNTLEEKLATGIKDPEKKKNALIALGMLDAMIFEIKKQEENINVETNIKENFEQIDPRKLNSLQLREYATIGRGRRKEGTPYDPVKLDFAERTISKEDQKIYEEEIKNSDKDLEEEIKKYDQEYESETFDGKLVYDKTSSISLLETAPSEVETNFFMTVYDKKFPPSLTPQEIKDKVKHLDKQYEMALHPYVALATMLAGNKKSLIEKNKLKMSFSIPAEEKDLKNAIKNKFLEIYGSQDLLENAVDIRNEGSNTSFYIRKISNQTELNPRADANGLYSIPSLSNSSLNKLISETRRSYLSQKEFDGKIYPSFIIGDGMSIVLNPGDTEHNNIFISNGGQGSSKSVTILNNLINAAVNGNSQIMQHIVIDKSNKFFASDKTKDLREKLEEKGMLSNPFSEFSGSSDISGLELKNYVDTFHKSVAKMFSEQKARLKGYNRLEVSPEQIPIKMIHADEFELFIDDIRNDTKLSEKDRKNALRKVSGIVKRIGTEGKKHGIYLNVITQNNIKEPLVRETLKHVRTDVLAFSQIDNPAEFSSSTKGYMELNRSLNKDDTKVAYIKGGDATNYTSAEKLYYPGDNFISRSVQDL